MFRFGRCLRFRRRGIDFKFDIGCRGRGRRFFRINKDRSNTLDLFKEDQKTVLQKQLKNLEIQKKYIEDQLENF